MPELRRVVEEEAALPEGYRMTELGPLPKEWNTAPFEETILPNKINVGKVKQKDYKKSGVFRIIDQGQALISGYWDDGKDVYDGPLPVIIFGDHTPFLNTLTFHLCLGQMALKFSCQTRANSTHSSCFTHSSRHPSQIGDITGISNI